MALFKRKAPASKAAPSLKAEAPKGRPAISLALQGGGSHGAFQWGVLDRLLEDDRFDIGAITASSAGAMNAATLISGHAAGGSAGAREALDKLWREVNRSGGKNVFGDTNIWSGGLAASWLKDTPFWRSVDTMTGSMSPYEFNPFNLNPLDRVLKASIDFEAVKTSPIKLFVAATAVRHGKARIFESQELTDQVLLASACLPHLFQAVTIDGEPYWDGGYLANPALWPLVNADTPDDILLLTLNPFERAETPRTPSEIVDRLNEIAFNAPLTSELRAIGVVQDLIEQGLLSMTGQNKYRETRIHAIEADGHLDDLSLRSKSNTEWSFLQDLKGRGRAAAEEWLGACADDVGTRASVDLQSRFV